MSRGELLTRASVWVSLGGYAIGVVTQLLSRGRRGWLGLARIAWTLGCLAMLAHLVFAFSFFYDWSHGTAYRETARQTAEAVGLNWGGGLYVNYVLLTAWIIDVALWWTFGLDAHRRRSRLLSNLWQGTFLFIVFNATVVFELGWLRWIGVGFCLFVIVLWWRSVGAAARIGSEI